MNMVVGRGLAPAVKTLLNQRLAAGARGVPRSERSRALGVPSMLYSVVT